MTSPSTDRRYGSNSGLGIKAPVRVATTANITLSGTQTIDGIAVVADDRVLVKDQTTTTDNGIYVVDTGAWSRAPDFNGNRDIVQGTIVTVAVGSTLANTLWRVSSANPIVIDTSAITFTPNTTSATDSSAISFTQAGTGATVRTAQAKMREVVSAEDFGADNTGATSMVTAVQNALTSISGGGELNFGPGTFLVDANIVVGTYAASDLKISGAGMGATIFKLADSFASNTNMFVL